MAPVRGREWEAVVVLEEATSKSNALVKCIYCRSKLRSTATRIRQHIISSLGRGVGACTGKPPKDLIDALTKEDHSKSEKKIEKQRQDKLKAAAASTMTQKRLTFQPSGNDGANDAVAKFFFAEGIPFMKVNSPYFRDMLKAVSKAPGYTPPDRHTLATTMLDKQYKETQKLVEQTFEGCKDVTLVSDGWKASNKDPLVNFVVLCGNNRYNFS
jgi:hypothetical protein